MTRQPYTIAYYQDGSDFYEVETDILVRRFPGIVRDYDVTAAKAARVWFQREMAAQGIDAIFEVIVSAPAPNGSDRP